jgi:thiamine biosynthesis lipoprotein
VGIQKPRGGGVLGAVEIDSGSIVTSGDYERFRIVDGVRYHHIFNSKTGYSCPTNQSVTVWGPDPVEADIMTTGLFCRSASEILEFINARSRLECLVVDSSGQIFISNGWKSRVEVF